MKAFLHFKKCDLFRKNIKVRNSQNNHLALSKLVRDGLGYFKTVSFYNSKTNFPLLHTMCFFLLGQKYLFI